MIYGIKHGVPENNFNHSNDFHSFSEEWQRHEYICDSTINWLAETYRCCSGVFRERSWLYQLVVTHHIELTNYTVTEKRMALGNAIFYVKRLLIVLLQKLVRTPLTRKQQHCSQNVGKYLNTSCRKWKWFFGSLLLIVSAFLWYYKWGFSNPAPMCVNIKRC